MRVLVIEDEPLLRHAMAQSPREAGHEVAEANNGSCGLECVRRKVPDLVLLDLQMPAMTGTEIRTEQLKDRRLAAATVESYPATAETRA